MLRRSKPVVEGLRVVGEGLQLQGAVSAVVEGPGPAHVEPRVGGLSERGGDLASTSHVKKRRRGARRCCGCGREEAGVAVGEGERREETGAGEGERREEPCAGAAAVRGRGKGKEEKWEEEKP
nr:unnamed protein product [Digitaria exilis]